MKTVWYVIAVGFFLVSVSTSVVFAQPEDEENIGEVESLLDKEGEKETEEVAPPSKDETLPDSIANLKNLQPFSDVAVIQRKFLPKTKRFELYGGIGAIVNNAFFMNFGPGVRFGYHVTENLGIEGVFMYLTTSNRDVTNDLLDKRGVRTDGLVAPDIYTGANVVWTPVYGKMSLFENRIVPFDMYFSAGGGMTTTNKKETSPTIEIGTGQRFALSKKMAFRWDFTWNFYSANYVPSSTTAGGTATKGSFDNLFLSLGISFFFPEASYR
ncbi:MAG: hypothetical protein A4S09_15580 [Proteobacteria bacterium SG_bin7]|nr:MAG: hypothetical protein A4S09_15580 [Proteobacteria bacterium SG_bin7]